MRFIACSCVAVITSAACISSAHAGIVRFSAIIDAAQETTGSTSTATGSAIMLYDATGNTLDLMVTINDFPNPLLNSHIHEGPPGMDGGPVNTLGAEIAYSRDGNTLTATFLNVTYLGTPATLLSGGAYLNFHTAAWPGGEIRGQLIPDPVKLTAIITPEQETGTVDSDAYGAAQATYDPMTNEMDVLIFVYNFTNTFTNSHFHDAPVGVSAGVSHGLGGAAEYEQFGNTYTQFFENLDYEGDPVALVSEGTYLNFHSNVYAPGEIRGQLYVSEGPSAGRLINVSARARVGTGEDVLITGMFVAGTEPVRIVATARGPFLTGFGIIDALQDPMLTVHDAARNILIQNDNTADAPHASLFSGLSFAPDGNEAGVLLLLPPGSYTNIVSGAGDTEGVAIGEAHMLNW